MGYGWAVLIVAGGGSYYFAKRSINADREERAAAEEKRRQAQVRLRANETVSRDAAMRGPGGSSRKEDRTPSKETASNQAPTNASSEGRSKRSEYEAADPFRSKKGDRFS